MKKLTLTQPAETKSDTGVSWPLLTACFFTGFLVACACFRLTGITLHQLLNFLFGK